MKNVTQKRLARRMTMMAATIIALLALSSTTALAAGEFTVSPAVPGAPLNGIRAVAITGTAAVAPCPAGFPNPDTTNPKVKCTKMNPDPVNVLQGDYAEWDFDDTVGATTPWGTEDSVQVVITSSKPAGLPLVGTVSGAAVVPPAAVVSGPVAKVNGGITRVQIQIPANSPAAIYKYQIQYITAGVVTRTVDPVITSGVPAIPPAATIVLMVLFAGTGFYFVRRRSTPRLAA
jgi:hypothetical protein